MMDPTSDSWEHGSPAVFTVFRAPRSAAVVLAPQQRLPGLGAFAVGCEVVGPGTSAWQASKPQELQYGDARSACWLPLQGTAELSHLPPEQRPPGRQVHLGNARHNQHQVANAQHGI